MNITTSTNINQVLSELQALQAKGEHMAPLFAEIANYLYNQADEAFESESSPDGTPWQELSDTTINRKGHSRKLHDTGHMRETLQVQSDNNSATVGTSAVSDTFYPYPAVHQFGTDNGKIPARPFLPFADNDLMDTAKNGILQFVHEYFTDTGATP